MEKLRKMTLQLCRVCIECRNFYTRDSIKCVYGHKLRDYVLEPNRKISLYKKIIYFFRGVNI